MTALARTFAFLIRFLSEIGALLAFTLWGFSQAGWFGVIPPLVAAAIWGRWMAPRSERRLTDPGRLVAELLFFLAATSAFAAAEAQVAAAIYGPIALVFAVLVRYTGEPDLAERGPKPAA
jgi:phosphate/sulfate permease